ncbi:tetratricopeptide repeat protein [Actinomadura sp. ATCC 31491]|uniref:Tetratricopeptide repeat protein n=1 Tax=Actinomadura luzonensis TaxID=2805427 RepID=A0ABT0FJ12_9ACTN|nr:BTAD domain-containing putative transcriptional regulator [Actinomadura luzonensis]MCK2212292.1 tetratricopeptide repeat protein [Actinomadura luzonensis]
MSDAELRFSVLGPVRAWRGATELDVGSPQQRLVLAVLLLARGRAVSHDQLLDALWGERPPRSAMGTLRTYVSRLRAALGADTVTSVGNGYAMPAATCDATASEELARAGRPAEALALWQGEPLAGLDGGYALAQRAHLAERRLVLLERRLAEDVEAGRPAEVVAELTALCAAHPTRERLAGLLMLALYRSGRQAEAIGVFTDTRKLLAEELGLDPSPELGELHRRIITADPGLGADPAGARPAVDPAPVPRQLPADMPDFTGRGPDIERVTRALAAGNGSALVISAVAGAGGMGKTTLAVHVAHRLAAGYPDGQLFADLQGAGPRSLEPGAVLGAFLRCLGVDAGAVPDSLEERAALYRSVLAGRRVLVLLDNAASPAQVRPLLPGAAGCAVLVTGRARLAGLAGAHHLDLAAMPSDEALALLARIVGEARVAAEWDEARELMKACGYLPLAIRIVASRLAARPGWSLARMRDRMADERRRLAELRVDDLAVEATFRLGYDQLDVAHAAAFRLLSAPNTPELSAAAAAAVLDLPEAEAEELCEGLVDVHLMDSPAPGRYRHHDLLKLFARARLDAEDGEQARRAALDRLLGFHIAGMAWIVAAMYPGDPLLGWIRRTTRPGPAFAGLDAALEWGAAEERNMLGLLHQIAGTPGGALLDAVSLLDMMSLVFDFESDTLGYEQAVDRLIAAASSRGDRAAETYARRKRGEILYARKAGEEAIAEVEAVRRLDPGHEFAVEHACAINVHAMIAHDRRQWDEAIALYHEAIGLWRGHGHRSYEAVGLGNLALALGEAGRGGEAVEVGEAAVAITRELGGGRPNPQISYQLAVALARAGRHEEALARFAEGRAEFQRLKQHTWDGITLRRMADTCLAMGRPRQAVDHAEEALAILVDPDQSWIRGKALTVLGQALAELGRPSRARACLTEALALLSRQDLPDADDVRALLAAAVPEEAGVP